MRNTSRENPQLMEPTFIDFWRELFFKPKSFFKKHFTDSQLTPAYYALALFVFGVGYGIDKIDRQLTKFDLKGNLDDIDFLNTWLGYWLYAVIGGYIGGYLVYLIGGWFFNVRLKWAKGTGNLDNSRAIFLYSGVVLSSISILIALISMLLNDKPYDAESPLNAWDLISMMALIFFIYYSVYVSYVGVRTTTDANETRAKLWFLILPIAFYTLAYVTVFILLYKIVV